MGNFFYQLYKINSHKKILTTLLLVSIFGIAIFLALKKLHYREDVLQLLPNEPHLQSLHKASTRIKSADMMLFMASTTDTAMTAREIIPQVHQFIDSLNSQPKSGFGKISPALNVRMSRQDYQTLLKYLPVLLDSSDYNNILQRLTPEAIQRTMLGNIKLLASPAGMVSKHFLMKDPLHLVPLYLEKLKRFQLDTSYKLIQNHIFTRDENYLIFFGNPETPASNTAKNAKMVDNLDKLITRFQQTHPEMRIQYFGAPAVAVGNARQIKRDIIFTVSLALILLGLFMALYYRRAGIFFVLFLPALFGGALALAILYLTRGEISAISLGIGSILLGITVDYALHLFTHYRTTKSVKTVLTDVAPPMLMSCLTTASAFLCLLFVRAEALHHLGLFAAISVSIAALFALLVMPLFFRKKTAIAAPTFVTSLVDRLTHYPLHKKRWIVGGVLLLTALFSLFMGKTRFEGDMNKMNYLTPKLKEAEKVVMQHSSFALRTAYLVTTANSIDNALQLQEQHLSSMLQSTTIKPENLSSASMLLPSTAKQQARIAKWQDFWTPQRIQQLKQSLTRSAAQYHIRPQAFESFYQHLQTTPEKLTWEQMSGLQQTLAQNFVNSSDSTHAVLATLKIPDEQKPQLYKHFENINGTTVFDKSSFTNHLVKALKDDFSTLVGYSMAVVFLILLIFYGRFELAIIAFLPMVISWIWTLGIMALADIPFTIFNIIISTFIFGLGIDYAIFIMRGLMKAYNTGEDHLPSFKSSVFLSAVTTVLGIGVLIVAQHPSLRSMAALSLIGISSVIFISYTVEPALYNWFLLHRQKTGKPAFTIKQLFLSSIGYSIFAIGASHATIYGIIMEIFGIRSHRGQKLLHYLIMWSNRLLIYGMANVKKRIINPLREDHQKPAIIIANHQSHLDLILLMMLHPKFIILTNDWVQEHKIYGRLVKHAGYLPVSMGYEALAKALQPKVERGYSIVIFPEGTRSKDLKMKRFHKGAFFLAEKLQLDILPIVLHGTGHAMTKGDDLLLKPEAITVQYLPRIPLDAPRFPQVYNKRAKAIGQYFRQEFEDLRRKQEVPAYFRDKLIKNYLFKGPVLEWYARVKTRLEKNYHFFHKRLPLSGTIVDIGCGYGFLSYMLHFTGNQRNIIGIDYDDEKITIAKQVNDRNKKVSFLCMDIAQADLPEANAFVLNDVLHYMPQQTQQQVLNQCLQKLQPGGICIVREANANLQKRHKGTKLTEFFSTKLLQFNKTADSSHALYFPTDKDIYTVTQKHAVDVKLLDCSRHTSNIIYLITKKAEVYEKV